MKNLAIALVFILLTSCSTTRIGKNTYLSKYDASKRTNLIYKDSKGKIKSLSEVQPDVAMSSIFNLTNKMKKGTEFDAEQTLQITKTVSDLGKRTEAVNILRDALFRLSEMTMNDSKMDNNSLKLFQDVLKTVSALATIDKIEAQTQLKQAEDQLLKTKSMLKN